MRTKALVIGALASEYFKGPWVDISESQEWDVIVEGDYGRMVVLAVDFNPPILLDGDAIRISGKEARVVINPPIPDVKTVTVRLRQVV